MAKIAGYGVFGLPNYIIWHFDTSEKEGNLHEKPVWLWPAVVVGVGLGMGVVWRYRRWVMYKVPVLRGLGNARGGKVRQY